MATIYKWIPILSCCEENVGSLNKQLRKYLSDQIISYAHCIGMDKAIGRVLQPVLISMLKKMFDKY